MPKYSIRGLMLVTAAAAVVIVLIQAIPWSQFGGVSHRPRHPCTNNLKRIGLALQNYHDAFRCFPPAYIADADGKPQHSWRVLLLPYLGLQDLYKQYDFNEPWNGPHNRKLANQIPSVYRCPDSGAAPGETSYVAIVGSQTGWPDTGSRNVREFRDGLSNTIAVTEMADSGISWLEPRDLTFAQALAGINPQRAKSGISSAHRDGAQAVFCDSHVQFLPNDIPTDKLRALLTADGGEELTLPNE